MPTPHGRKISAVFGGLALAAGVAVIPASPTYAEPDIDDVQSRVDKLYREAEVASERYNDARLRLKEIRSDLTSLKSDEKRQNKVLGSAQSNLEDSIVRQYQGESMSAVGQVVVSDDPRAFLSQMSTMSSFNDMQTNLFDDYSTELEALEIRRTATEKRTDELAEQKAELAKQKQAIDSRFDKAKSLLADLKAEERERLEAQQRAEERRQAEQSPEPEDGGDGGGEEQPPSDVPPSGRAGAVLDYAYAQVGDAYVYGAAGPDSFDCSGLTMMAWAEAGVSLPHSSSAQMSSGTPVSSSELQPGDLVFYYSPVSHVGIYAGNGQIVHAANPSSGVTTAPVFSMPFSGAVRPG